tara:strand:+ start:18 stop:320 length:303 start_codon:yes stop_codon:yes gene_type:complete
MNKKKGITHILSLHDVKKVGLSDRDFMQEQLKSLYSNEFLDGLNNDQIYDLFDEMILLPQLQHIKRQKPVKPRPDSNIYDLPIDDMWWLLETEKPEPEEV